MITTVYPYKWRVFFFWVGILLFYFSLLYVRTSCVSRHPVSYIISACLVSYCLLVRQQRFHHPTVRITSVFLVGCIKNSNITSKHDHCCILVHVSCFFWGGWDLALYCTYVPRVCRVIPCPILLVRASYHPVFSCDNNSVFITPHSEHQLLWWDV